MTPEQASEYLNGKFRSYDERAVRYRLTAYAMILMGFGERDSVLDLGGGDAELEKCLREEFGWTGVYTNVDHTTGKDVVHVVLNQFPGHWTHDFVTCLEVIEHIPQRHADRIVGRVPRFARKGVVFTTPNPDVQNVYKMDDTHINPTPRNVFENRGYTVEEHMLYDGYYSQGQVDGLIAYREAANV